MKLKERILVIAGDNGGLVVVIEPLETVPAASGNGRQPGSSGQRSSILVAAAAAARFAFDFEIGRLTDER